MLVNVRSKKKSGKTGPGNKQSSQGSRFQVLQKEEEGARKDSPSDSGSLPKQVLHPKTASKTWANMQNKLVEEVILGPVLSLEHGIGAVLLMNGDAVGVTECFNEGQLPRIPLVDLSNSSMAKGKGLSKSLRKNAGSNKVSLGCATVRQPFPKNSEFTNVSFSGVFGRCPLEEMTSKEGGTSRMTSLDFHKGNEQDGVVSLMESVSNGSGPPEGLSGVF